MRKVEPVNTYAVFGISPESKNKKEPKDIKKELKQIIVKQFMNYI